MALLELLVDNKKKQLVAAMLESHSCNLAHNSCNDWNFPEGWTHQEKVEFCKGYHEWNGDPEEFSEEHLRLPDFAVAAYLAHLMTRELA